MSNKVNKTYRVRMFGAVRIIDKDNKVIVKDSGGLFPLHILENPNDQEGINRVRIKFKQTLAKGGYKMSTTLVRGKRGTTNSYIQEDTKR